MGADGTIYVGSWDNYLYAINGDGTLKRKYRTGGGIEGSPNISPEGIVYIASHDSYLYALDSGTNMGLANTPWPKFHHDLRNTGNTLTGTVGTETASFAADSEWINRYAYAFDGTDYVIVDPDDDTMIIPAWQGFWVGTNEDVDLLIPKKPSATYVPTDPGLVLTMVPDKWYLVSAPLNPTLPELNSVFSSLGAYESTWRAVKWDYTYTGTSPTGGYKIYTDIGTLPSMIPGRGFWVKHINDESRSVSITGAPVIPSGDYYELKLPANGSGMTAHMVGNPFWYPIRWKDILVRKPTTGTAPVGKPVSLPGKIEKWFVGIKLETVDGTARDMYNRAGVVTTEGVNSKIYNAMDLIPPDSFVNVNLKDPADKSGEGRAYDFRTIGKNEYQWELDLSTSFTTIPVRLSLDNMANVPKGVQFTFKDMSTGEMYSIEGDRSFSLTLTGGTTHKYLLTAQMGPGSVTSADAEHPVSFGLANVKPNPFNPATTISFGIEKSGTVKLCIYSINGQLVETLADGVMSSGQHSMVWNAKDRSSGVYLLLLESGGKRDTKKMSLVK